MRTLGLVALAALPHAQGEPEPKVSFHRDVRPLLQASCQGCHQPAKASADLVLVGHGDVVADYGGEPLVIAGDPDASLVLQIVLPYEGEPPEMPKDAPPLTDEEVDLLRRWILEGAEDDTPAALDRTFTADDPPVYDALPVVTSLDFSPDGSLLAVAGWHEVLLHRSDGAVMVDRLIGLSERIESVRFSPDGGRLAVAGGTPGRLGEVQVWAVGARELDLSLPVTFDSVRGVSWSGDGKSLAFGCTDNTVRVVDAATGGQLLYQGAHEDWVLGTEFTSDSSHLISVSRDRSMKLYKVATEQFIDNITSITPGALKGGLMAVERHPLREEVLVGGSDGAPKVFRIYREKKRVIGDDYNLIRAFDGIDGRIFAVAWAPAGNRIFAGASLHGAGEVRAWAEDGALLWSHPTPGAIYTLAVHPGGTRIAAAGFDGQVRLLDATTGALLRSFPSAPLAAPAASE